MPAHSVMATKKRATSNDIVDVNVGGDDGDGNAVGSRRLNPKPKSS